jgi:hypothetical protein
MLINIIIGTVFFGIVYYLLYNILISKFANQKPNTTTQKPNTTTQKPNITTQKPNTTTQILNTTTQIPNTTIITTTSQPKARKIFFQAGKGV